MRKIAKKGDDLCHDVKTQKVEPNQKFDQKLNRKSGIEHVERKREKMVVFFFIKM